MSAPPMMSPPAPVATTAPLGGARTSRHYYDDHGRRRTADRPVPVDQFGAITGGQWRCRRCRITEWFPKGLRGAPVCGTCDHRMEPREVKDAPKLPWRDIAQAAERPLRPVWALAAAVGAGAAVGGADVPWLAPLVAAPAVGALVSLVAKRRFADRSRRLDVDDPDGQPTVRGAIDAAARRCGYVVATATGWLTIPAAVGVPTHGLAGHLATWGSLLAAWAAPAAGWWRAERARTNRPVPVALDEFDDTPTITVDPDEAEVLRVWTTKVAVRKGQIIDTADDGTPVRSDRDGPLAGAALDNYQPIEGGWGATIDGPVGEFDSDKFRASQVRIATAYRMHRSMITLMPDPEDENRAIVLAQRRSPLKDEVRWAGPDSINVEEGVATVGRYVDGAPLRYELYRPGWGCPHDFLCGTTGAGKSETLSGLLIVDRWASHIGADGVRRGLVADLLIDPQQGQSYEPFMDDLAAPVATSIDEAMLVVQAFKAEMLRRNAYLSKRGWRDRNGVLHRAEWVDNRGRTRYGRKWWNPLVDGPILTLNIDEAHEYLVVREFAALVIAGARMYRKCGMRIRVATHTPLLTDLGGSTALRDMLTGGFVWCGRTANSLSGPTAFNGRLPVDPRSIPAIPGSGFTLGRLADKPMMSRFMWEPDYYDLVRDADDEPIGYPAELPPHTVEAFGEEFARWSAALRAGEDYQPAERESVTVTSSAAADSDPKSVNAVLAVLHRASAPLDMDELDAALKGAGTPYSTRTVREVLKKLRDRGLVFSAKGRHELTPQATAEADEVEWSREGL